MMINQMNTTTGYFIIFYSNVTWGIWTYQLGDNINLDLIKQLPFYHNVLQFVTVTLNGRQILKIFWKGWQTKSLKTHGLVVKAEEPQLSD